MTNQKIAKRDSGPWDGAKLPRAVRVSRQRSPDGRQGGIRRPRGRTVRRGGSCRAIGLGFAGFRSLSGSTIANKMTFTFAIMAFKILFEIGPTVRGVPRVRLLCITNSTNGIVCIVFAVFCTVRNFCHFGGASDWNLLMDDHHHLRDELVQGRVCAEETGGLLLQVCGCEPVGEEAHGEPSEQLIELVMSCAKLGIGYALVYVFEQLTIGLELGHYSSRHRDHGKHSHTVLRRSVARRHLKKTEVVHGLQDSVHVASSRLVLTLAVDGREGDVADLLGDPELRLEDGQEQLPAAGDDVPHWLGLLSEQTLEQPVCCGGREHPFHVLHGGLIRPPVLQPTGLDFSHKCERRAIVGRGRSGLGGRARELGLAVEGGLHSIGGRGKSNSIWHDDVFETVLISLFEKL